MESNLKLIIGNKNYSSWSLRPWLFLKYHNISFSEVWIPLYTPEGTEQLMKYSPSGLVPALVDGDLTVWDSLAICEYVSEMYLNGKGWPDDVKTRAVARSVAAEMHSGFQHLRGKLSMNLKARFEWNFVNEDVDRDIRRIEAVWEQCRARYGRGGPWLFGEFSIADAMYAPVATRFHTYQVPISDTCREYVNHVLQMPEMREWYAAGEKEQEVIAQSEVTHLKRIK